MFDEKELLEISEKMGEAAHNAWMVKRRREKGWHSPEECPERLNAMSDREGRYCDKCHSCMRPYSELPESEKELDRQYPKLFLKIIGEMGYQIVKKG